MTYDRARNTSPKHKLAGAVVSRSAELVRGDFLARRDEGPLIRPSGTFSPRGVGVSRPSLEIHPSTSPSALA